MFQGRLKTAVGAIAIGLFALTMAVPASTDSQLRLRMQMELRSIVQSLDKTVLFVTHDLDEAVALADRCAIFTRGPGTVRKVLDIPLPRDRELTRLRHNHDYTELTAMLWDEMAPDFAGEEVR